MKRLAIFAGYDKDNIIHDYVVYYLSELSKSADIIYVSDNDFPQCELDKIKPYTIKIIAQRHGEYDFGSYKRGYLFAKQSGILDKYDFLILCNDSVFGPFYSFEKIFAEIPQRQDIVYGFSKHLETYCDWGGRKFIEEHLQSYFVVMPKGVFLSDWYSDFIKSIKKEVDKVEIVFKYEIGMSVLFRAHNIKLLSHYENAVDLSCVNPLMVLKNHDGIFLKKLHLLNFDFATICKMFGIIYSYNRYGGGKSHYDINLIADYYQRNKPKLVFAYQSDIIKHKRLNKKIAKFAKYIPTKYLRKGFFDRYIVS